MKNAVEPRLRRRPSPSEIEKICLAAEEAVESYLARVGGLKSYRDIGIVICADGEKPLRLTVDVIVEPSLHTPESDNILKDATEQAFKAAEEKAKALKLWRSSRRSKKS